MCRVLPVLSRKNKHGVQKDLHTCSRTATSVENLRLNLIMLESIGTWSSSVLWMSWSRCTLTCKGEPNSTILVFDAMLVDSNSVWAQGWVRYLYVSDRLKVAELLEVADEGRYAGPDVTAHPHNDNWSSRGTTNQCLTQHLPLDRHLVRHLAGVCTRTALASAYDKL